MTVLKFNFLIRRSGDKPVTFNKAVSVIGGYVKRGSVNIIYQDNEHDIEIGVKIQKPKAFWAGSIMKLFMSRFNSAKSGDTIKYRNISMRKMTVDEVNKALIGINTLSMEEA